MAEIAEAAGIVRATLSKALLDLTDEIGVKLSHGKHSGTREKYSAAQHAAVAAGRHASQKKAA